MGKLHYWISMAFLSNNLVREKEANASRNLRFGFFLSFKFIGNFCQFSKTFNISGKNDVKLVEYGIICLKNDIKRDTP